VAFWVVALSSPVGGYQHFGDVCCLHFRIGLWRPNYVGRVINKRTHVSGGHFEVIEGEKRLIPVWPVERKVL